MKAQEYKRIDIEKETSSYEFTISDSSCYLAHLTEGGEYSFSFHLQKGVSFSFLGTVLLKTDEVLSLSVSIFHEEGKSQSHSLVRGVAEKGQIFYKAYTGISKESYGTKSSQDAKFLLAGGKVSGTPALGPSSFSSVGSHSFSSIPLSSVSMEYYLLKGWTEKEAKDFIMNSFLETDI
jgi:Fe-S cluster assembly scaffold protein SufB